jgi:putative DNA primase/helicase
MTIVYGRDYPDPFTDREEHLGDGGEEHLGDGEQHRGQLRLAYRLAASHADRLMFVHGIGWHHWDGARWAEDERGEATRAVTDVLRDALSEAVKLDSGPRDKLIADVRKCETAHGIAGVLDLAAALVPFAHTVADLDVDPYLLVTASGTLDLRTGDCRPHDPADRCTKVTRAGYDPAARSDVWEEFLERVLPDPAVRGYLQRLAGLSLLGKVVEHIFTVITGTGANGKGTTYGALLWMLGDYGHAAESDLFMQAKANPNSASPALMGLRGKRLIVVSETERDQRLAVALMKNLTGGDPITARPLYGKPVTFAPSHTPLMITNYLPKVAGDDAAVWRRIRVVPFDVVIPAAEQDGHLGERLELDADAILTWAVDGYAKYTKMGLAEPEAVLRATDDYQQSSDAVARFIAEDCYLSPHAFAITSELFGRWLTWSAEDGSEPLSVRKFGEALDGHGYPTIKGTGGRRARRGIGLLADDEEADQ